MIVDKGRDFRFHSIGIPLSRDPLFVDDEQAVHLKVEQFRNSPSIRKGLDEVRMLCPNLRCGNRREGAVEFGTSVVGRVLHERRGMSAADSFKDVRNGIRGRARLRNRRFFRATG